MKPPEKTLSAVADFSRASESWRADLCEWRGAACHRPTYPDDQATDYLGNYAPAIFPMDFAGRR